MAPTSVKRLFIDPGSKSCGWALFEDGRCLAVGTIKSEHKNPFRRLANVSKQAKTLSEKLKPKEVHFETLNYRTNYVCIWSVGVIGVQFAEEGCEVSQDVPIKSWQAHCDWRAIEYKWDEITSPHVFDSHDAWAAYWQGIWWLKKEGII